MQTLALAPKAKKSLYAVKLWEVTPPQETGEKAYTKETKSYLALSLEMA